MSTNQRCYKVPAKERGVIVNRLKRTTCRIEPNFELNGSKWFLCYVPEGDEFACALALLLLHPYERLD
ncbi:hypothetical protein GOA86_07065 [Sinorhizobium meliloti]|nr:hypothetical protein [Sinorhizobium meliloti]